MRLRPDIPTSGPDVVNRPAPPLSTASTARPGTTAAVPQPKHLHPALLAALRRRMAQAAGHHPGEPFH
ncbi:MAG TPA: hypothetical protein VLW05_01795 [Gaiellaceae bacterium]|nr:hypothetical protein [Gaiellaceae bacterium]